MPVYHSSKVTPKRTRGRCASGYKRAGRGVSPGVNLDSLSGCIVTDDDTNTEYLLRASQLFPRIEGKPFANVQAATGAVCVGQRIHSLRVDDGVLCGECDWLTPPNERPQELTDGLAIGSDLLDVGHDWWLDRYFDWYFVFDENPVDRSLKNDFTWVREFLTARGRTSSGGDGPA